LAPGSNGVLPGGLYRNFAWRRLGCAKR